MKSLLFFPCRYWINPTKVIKYLSLCLVLGIPGPGIAEQPSVPVYHVEQSGEVLVNGILFPSRYDFLTSDYFQTNGLRCATPSRSQRISFESPIEILRRNAVDCTSSSTNPTATYDPNILYEIPVVVHIIQHSNGDGAISDVLVTSQIEILNEDFLAMMGTLGANGLDAQIRFVLATTDPVGTSTTGITRTTNDVWFNDSGSYWDTLAWDPNTYMNVYTNSASGALGYVPFLPADGGGSSVGGNADRIVILWDAFGRDALIGAPFDKGRTLTHEVGHYLGLEHVFAGSSCPSATPPDCYTNGDLICDTTSQSNPAIGCPTGLTSCSSLDNIDNYMDYSDDTCMERFTLEQVRRIRCSLESYRPSVFSAIGGSDGIFSDGFESGITSNWSVTQ